MAVLGPSWGSYFLSCLLVPLVSDLVCVVSLVTFLVSVGGTIGILICGGPVPSCVSLCLVVVV